MATILVRLRSREDVDKFWRFIAEKGITVTSSSAGYRGVFVRLSLSNAAADALGRIGLSDRTTITRLSNHDA